MTWPQEENNATGDFFSSALFYVQTASIAKQMADIAKDNDSIITKM